MAKQKKVRVHSKAKSAKRRFRKVRPVIKEKPILKNEVVQKNQSDVITPVVQNVAKESEKKNEVTSKTDKSENSNALEVAVVLSNTLVPHHDEKAIQLALMHTKDLDVAKIFFNGDWIDYYHRSEIDRNPLRIFMAKEISIMHSE